MAVSNDWHCYLCHVFQSSLTSMLQPQNNKLRRSSRTGAGHVFSDVQNESLMVLSKTVSVKDREEIKRKLPEIHNSFKREQRIVSSNPKHRNLLATTKQLNLLIKKCTKVVEEVCSEWNTKPRAPLIAFDNTIYFRYVVAENVFTAARTLYNAVSMHDDEHVVYTLSLINKLFLVPIRDEMMTCINANIDARISRETTAFMARLTPALLLMQVLHAPLIWPRFLLI